MTIQYIIDEIHDTLKGHGITRTDPQIEAAVYSAADSERDERGWWVDVDSLRANDRTWDTMLHGPFRIYDLLEVDSDGGEGLYDRLEGEAL